MKKQKPNPELDELHDRLRQLAADVQKLSVKAGVWTKAPATQCDEFWIRWKPTTRSRQYIHALCRVAGYEVRTMFSEKFRPISDYYAAEFCGPLTPPGCEDER